MNAYLSLSPLIRNLFQLWALLLCFVAIICVIYALLQKQYRFVFSALPCLLISYFIRQITLELSLYALGNQIYNFCLNCGQIPFFYYVIVMVLLTLVSVWILHSCIYYNQNNINIDSIRLCADSLPCGICYWRDSGRVIFTNECMSKLCFSLTGFSLQNGNEFISALPESLVSIGDKVWSFSKRTVDFQNKPLHELIATDVTELYQKTRSLKKDNEEFARYNESLRNYNLNIDETVRQQEILRAKLNIHDEMNKIMLTTVAAGTDGYCSDDEAFALWKNNALLLCREASEDSSDSIEELEGIAKALKINLVWQNNMLDLLTAKQRSLFFSTAQEALANAFKHASANELCINFISKDNMIICNFSNKGILPNNSITFTGGLNNLRRLAEMQDASICVSVTDVFNLSLSIPLQKKIHRLAD